MTTAMVSDDFIISGLMEMNPEVIDSVFYRKSEYRRRMERAIKEIWGTKDEYISVVLMSFFHYLTNSNLKRINEWRVYSKKEKIPLTQLLQDALSDFLAKRIEFKDQSRCLYAVLTGTDDALPMMHKRLRGKEALNQYLWDNGFQLDAIVDKKMDALNDLAPKDLREQLRKALCIHPEKILESYDFSEPLDNWRETILNRRLSQICCIYMIDRLLAHDGVFTERLFHPGSQNWEGIGNSICSAWDINSEDITAVIKTFIYSLIIRSNGEELRKIKKGIARKVPYFALPFSYDGKQPKEWFLYDDEAVFQNLLTESAFRYARKRKEYKEERRELGELMFNQDDKVRTDYLWGVDGEKYEEKIDKTIEALKKIGIEKNTEILKNQLFHYLCDDTIGLLVRYDFNKYLKDWCQELAESYIEDRPRLDVILSGRGVDKLFKAEYKDLLAYAASQYEVKGQSGVLEKEDLIQDVFVLLYEDDRKTLRNFKFESSLHSYIFKIATNRAMHEKKIEKEKEEVLNDIINGESKVEKKAYPEIVLRDKAGIYESLVKLLRQPGMKEYFGFGGQDEKNFSNRLEIIEKLFVHLEEYTSKAQKERSKELKIKFEEKGFCDSYLAVNKKRAITMLEQVRKEIHKLISKENLTPVEKGILNEFGIDETTYNNYLYSV